jgi:hypothetical protein
MATPDETPTERQPAKWVGSASVPENDRTRRRRTDDTLDLPIEERVPPPPEIRYVHVPVHVPVPVPAYGQRYAPPPPGYRPPMPPPQYRRRRRKWPWVFAFLMLACLGCCGGVVAWAKPYYDQYPATAVTTAAVTGLKVIDDSAAIQTAERLRDAVESSQLDESRFVVVYADQGNRQSRVTVFGATRFVGDPKKDLDAALGKLTQDLQLNGLREVDAGPLGGEQRCGTGKLDGKSIALCAWADHGSLGVALFAGRTVEAGHELLLNIRGAVIQR